MFVSRRVTILGSRKDALHTDGDFLYAANRSLKYFPDVARTHKRIVFVSNAATMNDVAQIMSRIPHETVKEVIHVMRPDSETSEQYRAENFECDLYVYSTSDTQALLQDVCGLEVPIAAMSRQLMGRFRSLIVPFLKMRYPNAAMFRPSTGVLALLLAIARFGDQATYTLAGIGATSRHSHPNGEVTAGTSRRLRIPQHVMADCGILQSLSWKYDISSDDQYLAQLCNLQYVA